MITTKSPTVRKVLMTFILLIILALLTSVALGKSQPDPFNIQITHPGPANLDPSQTLDVVINLSKYSDVGDEYEPFDFRVTVPSDFVLIEGPTSLGNISCVFDQYTCGGVLSNNQPVVLWYAKYQLRANGCLKEPVFTTIIRVNGEYYKQATSFLKPEYNQGEWASHYCTYLPQATTNEDTPDNPYPLPK